MRLFGGGVSKRTESAVLIDIGAASVGGACAKFVGDEPTLVYTRRLPIELRKGEAHERAMLRALEVLGDALIREGAPALLRETGSGTPVDFLVSIDSPWQQTVIRTERIEKQEPFVFTKGLVNDVLKKAGAVEKGMLLSSESIIGTILNGYETRDPYGKRVHRASVLILTSYIDHRIAEGVTALLERFYHTKHIPLISGSSLRYQVVRIAFPYERDAIILDASSPLVALALVRNSLLAVISETPDGAVGSPEWLKEIRNVLSEFAKRYPLPRTIFLLARETDVGNLRETLAAADIGSLWLSDSPPNIVSILTSHVASSVHQAAESSPDLHLILMALYWQHRNTLE
ncbi:MAG TPA: hypothetical protein VMV50_03565 [Candidatus Paceibacterota bacterium]|nr:hypothetical protein [Candidatus Paceibacterota bacterium]